MGAKVKNTNKYGEYMKTNFINLLAGRLNNSKFQLGLVLLGALGILGSMLLVPQAAYAQTSTTLIAPTVLAPKPAELVTEKQPVFAGVTYNNTLVDVYIDGVLSGRAKVKNSPSGVASWAYRAATELDLGDHRVYTVARSEAGVLRSPESINISFRLEEPFPTPTLGTLLVDSRTTYTKPWVNGVTKNDSIIDIYIDGKLNSTIQVASDSSGTAKFEYQVPELTPGWHAVKVQAKDSRGKLSKFSPSQVFEVRQTKSEAQSLAPGLTGSPHQAATTVVAPTLTSPASSSITDQAKPIISGLAHNGQSVEVFIDGRLNGEIAQQEHESGVYSFAYNPFLALTPGVHTVSARTVDGQGEKSGQSNTLSFLIKPKTIRLVISPEGVSQTRIAAKTGTVAATSTEEIVEPQVTEKEIVEESMSTTKPAEAEGESANMASEATEQQIEIVVIGKRSTSTADTTEPEGNTILVVILAVAAIIIIGLISWYTSREETRPEDDLFSKTDKLEKSNKSNKPKPDAPIWNEEPTDVGPPDHLAEDNTKDDIPPPPPPPALGI